jgi:hypothetical protein
VVARGNSSTVVVTPRGISEDVKITLHEDWDWWFAFHNERRALELTGKFDWEAVRWKPPEPNIAGCVHAVSVGSTRRTEQHYDEDVSAKIAWLDPAAPGHRVGIHLVIARPNDVEARTNGEFVDGFTLADGRLLLVYRSHSPFTPEMRSRIERKRAEHPLYRARTRVAALTSAIADRSSGSMVLIDHAVEDSAAVACRARKPR